jgi:hypothetical protein
LSHALAHEIKPNVLSVFRWEVAGCARARDRLQVFHPPAGRNTGWSTLKPLCCQVRMFSVSLDRRKHAGHPILATEQRPRFGLEARPSTARAFLEMA